MAEDLIQKIKWQRITLNAISVFCIVFASSLGSDAVLALKAGFVAALLAFGREIQEAVQNDSGTQSNGNGTKLSNYLLF